MVSYKTTDNQALTEVRNIIYVIKEFIGTSKSKNR